MPGSSAEADAILLFGGDGTIHRHLPQLVRLALPVLVVPCGSGNDFTRALGLRRVRDSVTAWQNFAAKGGNVRTIDLGVITPLADSPQRLKPVSSNTPNGTSEDVPFPMQRNFPAAGEYRPPSTNEHLRLEAGTPHYFCCIAGVGLDGEVARRANRLPRWLRGHGGYALSLPAALLRFAPLPMKIFQRENSSGSWAVTTDKPTVLAAFANAPVYGGGMRIAPRARMDDGQLDICLVMDINMFKLFCLFPSVYFGRHLGLKDVEYFQSDGLRLETEYPLDVYADGEFVCQTPVEVGVAPGALRVIVPA